LTKSRTWFLFSRNYPLPSQLNKVKQPQIIGTEIII